MLWPQVAVPIFVLMKLAQGVFRSSSKLIEPNLRWLSNKLLYIVFRILRGTILLQVDNAYKEEFSFALSLSMWPEKESRSSIQMPRNLTDFSGHVWPTLVIVLSPMIKSLTWEWIFGFLNKMYFGFFCVYSKLVAIKPLLCNCKFLVC